MITICVANHKGGVAKTTTAGALCSQFARDGYSVLAIDMDPQADLSDILGVTEKQRETQNMYSVLSKGMDINDIIVNVGSFDIAPSDIDMSLCENEANDIAANFRLKEILADDRIQSKYDIVVIDTPPSLGVITIRSLTAADYVLVPTDTSISSAKGIIHLMDTIRSVKKYFNHGLSVAGVLLIRVETKTNVAKDITESTKYVCDTMGIKMFDTVIRKSTKIPESHTVNADLWDYSPNSPGAMDYANMFKELKEVLNNGKEQ